MENIQNYLNQLEQFSYNPNMPVVVDFYASWCGPCRNLAPNIDKLQNEFAGRVQVLKIDVDKHSEFANAAQVRSIPTLFFINKDGLIERHVGGLTYESLYSKTQSLL